MSSYEPVTALVRGLDVLHALNTLGGRGGVGALYEITAIPKPTIVRILETLIFAGYVQRVPATRNYGLTARCMALSGGFSAYDYLLRQATPVLDALRQRLVWPSDLAVFDRNAMAIIETSRTPGVLSFNRTVGSRVPVLATALGRCYLAHMESDACQRVLSALEQSDEPYEQMAKSPEQVLAMLDAVRQRGYAISDQEHMKVVRAIAFPIFFQSRILASVNVFVVAEAMSLEQLIERYEPVLRDAVHDIENALDGGGEMQVSGGVNSKSGELQSVGSINH